MKNIYLLIIIFLFSCSSKRNLNNEEIKVSEFSKTHQKILNKFENIVIFQEDDYLQSKLVFFDKKGIWYLIEWDNNKLIKKDFRTLPRYIISDSLVVEVEEELSSKRRKLNTSNKSSWVNFEYKYPADIERINYENVNSETFKNEKFNSEYLQIVQKILIN